MPLYLPYGLTRLILGRSTRIIPNSVVPTGRSCQISVDLMTVPLSGFVLPLSGFCVPIVRINWLLPRVSARFGVNVASDPAADAEGGAGCVRSEEEGEGEGEREEEDVWAVRRSPLAARRSPLAARSPLAPRPDLSGLLTCHEQQPTTLRSRRRPSRPPPTPARHHGEDKLPPPHTLPHPAPHETRRATRCRHPENSLTSPYRAVP